MSQDNQFYCWECRSNVEVTMLDEDTLVCRNCNGTFVEKVQDDDRPEVFANSSSSSSSSSSSASTPQPPSQAPFFLRPNGQGTHEGARIQFVVTPMVGITPIGGIAEIFESLANMNMNGLMPFSFGPNLGNSIGSTQQFRNINDLLAHLLETYDGPMGAPPTPTEVINALPEVAIQQEHLDTHDSCSVCKEDFVLNEKATKLPCSHLFHKECIVPWLKQHCTCPLCRKSLPVDANATQGQARTTSQSS